MRTQILKPRLSAAIEPLLLSLGLRNGMGMNISLLIAFGPLLALLINATSIISFDWENPSDNLKLNFNAQKRWTNWLIIFLAGLYLLILFLYLIGENCK